MPKFKRRIYLVDKKFQLRVFYNFLLMVTFAAVLTSFIVFLYSERQERKNPASLYLVTENIGEDPKVVKQTDIILPALVVAEGITVMMMALFVLFYSHRMAGPVYKFKKVTEELSKGNFDIQVHLRKNDEFKDLAESFNMMITKFKEKYST